MVADNDAPHGTAFTVSVDYKHGTTTGISAEDRTATVRGLANNNAGAADFVRPGHVFPLIAKDGGVLMRSGHTEAAIDLCRLANLEPVGVICELVNDDGTVMRGPQIKAFAEKHKLKQHLGRRPDRLSPGAREAGRARRRVSGRDRDRHAQGLRLRDAVRQGAPHGAGARPHRRRRATCRRGCTAPTSSPTCSAAAKAINAALARFKQAGRGVIVVSARRHRRRAGAGAAAGRRDAAEAARTRQWREVGLGAQILKDLGVRSIRLLSSTPAHLCRPRRLRDRDHRDRGAGGVGVSMTPPREQSRLFPPPTICENAAIGDGFPIRYP